MAQAKEAEHNKCRVGVLPPPKASDTPRLFSEVLGEYMEWGRATGGHGGHPWGEGHARVKEQRLSFWQKQLGLQMIADLEGCLPRVEKALRELVVTPSTPAQAPRKPAPKTLQGYAEALRAFILWCKQRGYLDTDPLAGMAGFNTDPQTQRRCVTAEEITALLAKCAEHRRLVYEVAFASGLRAGELRALTVKHLDTAHGGLNLEAAWTKGRKATFQPLASWLVERLDTFAKTGTAAALYRQFLEHYHRDGKALKIPADPLLYVPSHPARDLGKDLEAAGLTKWAPGGKVDFHSLRVAYVSFVLEAGANVKEAQALARHSTPDLTMNVYARARAERLAEVAEAVGETIRPAAAQAVAIREGTTGQEIGNIYAPTMNGTGVRTVAASVSCNANKDLQEACGDRDAGSIPAASTIFQ
ncbi:MAG: site-specific integrase [Planctomycetota bacterium]